MILSRIMPGRLKFDVRTFECVKCEHVEKILVAIDPIQSDVLGWFLGNSAPPLAAVCLGLRSSGGESPPWSNLAVATVPALTVPDMLARRPDRVAPLFLNRSCRKHMQLHIILMKGLGTKSCDISLWRRDSVKR